MLFGMRNAHSCCSTEKRILTAFLQQKYVSLPHAQAKVDLVLSFNSTQWFLRFYKRSGLGLRGFYAGAIADDTSNQGGVSGFIRK